jgi:hypothetical protein
MIYFIGWVVFLLLAVVAVPVAMKLEGKSRQRVAYDGGDESTDQHADGAAENDDGELQPLEDAADGFGEAEAVDDFGGGDLGDGNDFGGEMGAEDFGAFDEELK